MPEEYVALEGFLLRVSCPSEDRLTVAVDATGLPWDLYARLIEQLEDYLHAVDEAHARDPSLLAGRGPRSRYRRLQAGREVVRGKVVRFAPVPSRLVNAVRHVRSRLYERLNRDAVVLFEERSGNFRRKVYLMPFQRAPAFMAFVDELNRRVSEVRSQVEEFRASGWFRELSELLASYGLQLPELGTLPDVKVSLTPVKISREDAERLIEERYREVLHRLSEEERRGLEAIRRELEERRRELLQGAVDEIWGRAKEVLAALAEKGRLGQAARRLEELRALAEDVGLRSLASAVMAPLSEALAALSEGRADDAARIASERLGLDLDSLRQARLEALDPRIASLVD